MSDALNWPQDSGDGGLIPPLQFHFLVASYTVICVMLFRHYVNGSYQSTAQQLISLT